MPAVTFDNNGNVFAPGNFYANGQTSVTVTGFGPTRIPLTADGRNSDGSVLAAAATSGKFGITNTLGTTLSLVTESANNSTVTDTVVLETQLSKAYVAGAALTVTANVAFTIGSGVLSVKTVQAKLYKISDNGTPTAELLGASAQTLSSGSATDYTFPLASPSGLSPADRLLVVVIIVLTETSTHAVTANLNSVRLS